MTRRPPTSTPFPSTTLFRSHTSEPQSHDNLVCRLLDFRRVLDRKSTRLNSSHTIISYAVFCLKKRKWTGAATWPAGRAILGAPVTRGVPHAAYSPRPSALTRDVSNHHTADGLFFFFFKRPPPHKIPPPSPPPPPSV